MKEEFVIDIIRKHCEKQNSAAYFECICNELFGEFNEETEKTLNEILENLVKKGYVCINGDRIHLNETKSCDFIICDYDEGIPDILRKADLKFNVESIDIGHGCNVLGTCVKLLHEIPSLFESLISIGSNIAEIKVAYDGFSWLFNKLKEIKIELSKSNEGYSPSIYLCENILLDIVIKKILDKYNITFNDIYSLRLCNSMRVKVGALGLYAIQNHNYSENSLEGSPESIIYYVFELSSKKLKSDREIIRCEILTDGTIKYFDTMSISTGNNFKS